ncbi:MAG: hypothetical protein ACOY4I_07815 [Bacillota bacterium]
MEQDLLEYRLKKHFASIDRLITQLVIIRRYIDSTKIGVGYCREHITRGPAPECFSMQPENELFVKNQEQLLIRLRLVEKRVKKQLRQSNRELASICGQQPGGRQSIR